MAMTNASRPIAETPEDRRRFLTTALVAFGSSALVSPELFAAHGPGQSPSQGGRGQGQNATARVIAPPSSWLNPNAETVPVEIAMTRAAEADPVAGSPAASPANLPTDIADVLRKRKIKIEYVGKGLYREPDPARYHLIASNGELASVDVEAPPDRKFWAAYRDERLARTLAVLTGLREDLEFHNGGITYTHRIIPAQNELLKRAPIASIRPQVPAKSLLVIRRQKMDLATTFRQRWSPLTCELSNDPSRIVHGNTEAGVTNGAFNQAVVVPFPSGDPVQWLFQRDVQIMRMLIGSGVLLLPPGFALPA